MQVPLPKIIQGGMGVGVSSWRLARAVSKLGQIGVVSGTALDVVLARRLQDGDPGGHIRRALAHFTFPKMAQRVLDALFIPGGKDPSKPYKAVAKPVLSGEPAFEELCIVSNFVEVFLAREGHSGYVGINYLEKIQIPHLPSLYGAMLAGVAVVVVGAGIAIEMPVVLDALARHQATSYPLHVQGAPTGAEAPRSLFEPAAFWEDGCPVAPLSRPDFLPIVSSDALASVFVRKAKGRIDGFVIETPVAGGHNAPPRGATQLTPDGQPVYGTRDVANLAAMRALGLPFWLGGSYASPEKVQDALAAGAAGVQVGTAFALCVESGLHPEVRRELVALALAGQAHVFTDPRASPTGFPFKVAQLAGSLSEEAVYLKRRRVCDLGYLREPYLRADGTIGYRCPAEPEAAYLAKGGQIADTVGRRCVCNGLLANIGLAQVRRDGIEPYLITLGDSFADIGRFCSPTQPEYTAADVIRVLLG